MGEDRAGYSDPVFGVDFTPFFLRQLKHDANHFSILLPVEQRRDVARQHGKYPWASVRITGVKKGRTVGIPQFCLTGVVEELPADVSARVLRPVGEEEF